MLCNFKSYWGHPLAFGKQSGPSKLALRSVLRTVPSGHSSGTLSCSLRCAASSLRASAYKPNYILFLKIEIFYIFAYHLFFRIYTLNTQVLCFFISHPIKKTYFFIKTLFQHEKFRQIVAFCFSSYLCYKQLHKRRQYSYYSFQSN